MFQSIIASVLKSKKKLMEINDFNRLISQHKTSSCKTLNNSYSNFFTTK